MSSYLAENVSYHLVPAVVFGKKHLRKQEKRQSVCNQDELVAGDHLVYFRLEHIEVQMVFAILQNFN